MANALVCLHASAGAGRQWSPLAAALGDRYTLHAPDLGGAATRASLDEDVAIAEAALATAGAPAHLVGHSYGGAVALLAAVRNPRAVASLVMYEPVPFWLLRRDAGGAGPGSERSARAWREVRSVADGLASEFAAGRAGRAARDFVDYWSGSGAWASMGARQQEAVLQRMPGVLANFDCLSAESVPLAAIAQLPLPAMWIGGAVSREPPQRLGELLGAALPQMVRYTLPAVGHMGPVTHAGLVNALVRGFVDAHRPRASAAAWRKAA